MNNVGTGVLDPFADLTNRDWVELFELNVVSGVCLSRHSLATSGAALRVDGCVVRSVA